MHTAIATIFTRRRAVTMAGDAGQAPFARVASVLGAALVIGAGGGFALAATLTLTRLLGIPEGAWWVATAQAHGHLQLYGWAGLLVLGVALHFLPRLRGAPLAGPNYVRALLICQVMALVLRAMGQPLWAGAQWQPGRGMLLASGGVELVALLGAVTLMAVTLGRGPALATRKAFVTVAPFIAVALVALALATLANLANVAQAASSPTGLVPGPQDALNVTLGLFGFLVPIALAMSAQALPMYAGLTAFPRRIVWPLAGAYAAGLTLLCVALVPGAGASWAAMVGALGNLLLAGTLLVFLAVCGGLMRRRGKLPRKVANLAPVPEAAATSYRRQVANQRTTYGPFVALIGSAYAWAAVGSAILLVNGAAILAGAVSPPVATDAAGHAFAVGFVALLIAGISARMLPGFSGGNILSPWLVAATLWLGNLAALLRVGSVVVGSVAGTSGFTDALFGLSGPVGLAFAICLAVNLWPAIFTSRPAPMR